VNLNFELKANAKKNNPLCKSNYVLITPARNEAKFIANTIKSVEDQIFRPLCWVIVDDGSSDKTMHIVRLLIEKLNFIKLIGLKRKGEMSFVGKAIAFACGLKEIANLEYKFIGNLDADISLQSNYFNDLIAKMESDSKIGIGGGIVYTKIGEKYVTFDTTIDSVGGAVQMFRKECFEEVGGYKPLKYGGIDAAAELTAKMLGWKVQKFPELRAYENRRTGSAQARPIKSSFQYGQRFHSLGYHPFHYFIRCVYRIKSPPLFLGSIASYLGFMVNWFKKRPVFLAKDIVHHMRCEHSRKIKNFIYKILN
jgi:poly-beta-1,6-N-acetyl-D-glucosamine synthase